MPENPDLQPPPPDAVDVSAGVRAIAAAVGIHVAGEGAPIVKIEENLNDVAGLLAPIVARLDLFESNGEFVFYDFKGERRLMDHRVFGTWIADYVMMAKGFEKETGIPIQGRLRMDECSVLLACERFRQGVRHIAGVNRVRLPVIRADGSLEKLPWGYDAETQIYTIHGGLDYPTDISLESAKVGLGRVDGDFPFSDARSIAVQRAANLALFCKHLPGGNALRPGFLWLGNTVGCGKSVLAKSILYPVMGSATTAKMKAKEDLDKELEAFVRAGVPYIFLDNVYGGINSASLDQLLTSKRSTGRALGGHQLFDVENTALIVVTGNRLELNEDAARRFLVVDLFEKGDADTREIAERLDDDIMETDAWRQSQLARLWALVANWHAQGKPRSTTVLSTYERYGEMLGGIVEAAGYACPFQKAIIPDAILPDKAEFAELVTLLLQEMAELTEKDFTLEDLAKLARSAQIFQKQVGTQAEGVKLTIKEGDLKGLERSSAADEGLLTSSHRSAFSKRIVREIGSQPTSNGQQIEFGRREQSRKATFTIRRLPS